jgi:hypothetical protein
MSSSKQFDVFLAHSTVDKPQVRILARKLRERGLTPWLDEEQIAPGQLFQSAIQKAIPQIKAAAIIIGSTGLGKWQALELQTLISQFVHKGSRVIPVLLPDVDRVPDDLPILQQFNWVSFANIDDGDAFYNLEWGITGVKPSKQSNPSVMLSPTYQQARPGAHEPNLTIISEEFDILLCYQDIDKWETQEVAKQLERFKIRFYPNHWVTNKNTWEQMYVKLIGKINALGIFIGNNETPWEEEGVEELIWRFINDDLIIIPIFLSTAHQDLKLPLFIRNMPIVDFRRQGYAAISKLVDLIQKNDKKEKYLRG